VSEIEVLSSIEEAKPHWRALEQKAAGTPFQRFAWMASYAGAISAALGAKPAILLIRGADRQPAAIMPLETVRRGGLTLLRSMGGKHASFHVPLTTAEGAAIIAENPARLLRLAGERAGGAHLAVLTHQPFELDGAANPLASAGVFATSGHAYETTLACPAEAFFSRNVSADARKKLRKKRKALEKIGPICARRLVEPTDIETTLAAFLAQRERRFQARTVPNSFAGAPIQAFLRAATKPAEGQDPAIELHALRCGERIIAVFGLAIGFSRASAMFTSFDDDEAIARLSPGSILLHEMVLGLIGRGFKRFDLGVGEARYKSALCDREIALANCATPLTTLGRAACPLLRESWRLESAIKRSSRLTRLANRARRALGASG
jgi:CelD/BcsL family acetyltransferase involved in cellulose biosynthesis